MAWGSSESPLASAGARAPLQGPRCHTLLFSLASPQREKPKGISFGGLKHHGSFKEPVTRWNCKDTFTLITYVFTELTKLPNQLLC